MSYLSFYRKYRPQKFEEVVGQEHIVRTITNAIELDRVSHAYLFCGPRGTGKTTMAKLLAKALNCVDGPTSQPCGVCDSCRSVVAGTSVDVVEIDAASNRGINEIRELQEKIRFAPSVSRVKVYIIDEVHMLTQEAFNALLKTLEEPPAHAMFVLATTEPHKIPETILSRCQRFDFHKLSPTDISGHLAAILQREGASADKDALRMIALHGDGSVRDSISILEQCYSYSGDHISVADVVLVLGITPIERIREFVEAISERDIGRLLQLVAALSSEGRDFRQFLQDAVSVYRDLAVLKLGSNVSADGRAAMLSRLELQEGQAIASGLQLDECLYVIGKIARIDAELKTSTQPSIALEVGLIELIESIDSRTDVSEAQDIQSLSKRLSLIERKVTELIKRAPTGEADSDAAASDESMASADVHSTGAATAGLPSRPSPKARRPSGDQVPESSAEGRAAENRSDGTESGETITDQDQLNRLFGEILDGVKARSVPLYAVLMEGKPAFLRGDTLVIGFAQQRSFHMGRVSEAKNRQIIEDVAALILGRAVNIQAKPADEVADIVPGASSKRGRKAEKAKGSRTKPEDDPLVKSLIEALDGRIVDSSMDERDGDSVEGKHQQANETGSEDADPDAQGAG